MLAKRVWKAWRTCALALCLTVAALPVRADSSPPLTLGVAPHFIPSETHRAWAPLADRLSAELGRPVRLKLYRTVAEYEEDMVRGGPDIAFMSGYMQVITHENPGYVPLVRDASPVHGIIVARRDGPVKGLDDLRGKEIVFPSPNAYASSVVMRAQLSDKERLQFSPRYASNGSNLYRLVLMGLAPAGTGVSSAFDRESPEVRSQLQVIYTTPPLPAYPLSAHKRLPQSVRDGIVRAVLAMARDETARPVLRAIEVPQPVVADYGRDYAPLEKLGLERYAPLHR